jgi:lysophospholipase L1-like esterase
MINRRHKVLDWWTNSAGSIPVNTVAPAISGTQQVGQTITSSTGTWNSTPTSYTYQWKRDSVSIGGRTTNSYTLVAMDALCTITCEVTAINAYGSAVASASCNPAYSVQAIGTISLSGRTVIEAFGDSVTVGLNASPSTNAYIKLFSAAHGAMTVNTRAVSGKGVWNQASLAQSIVYSRTTCIVPVMVGLNDIRRNGSALKTLKKIEAGFRSILIGRFLSSTIVASGSSGVTRTGSISAYNGTSVGGAFGTGSLPGNFATNGAPGSVCTWTWTFTGTAFAIQFYGCDGVITTHDTAVDIKVDGTTVETINLNNWYDGVSDGAYDNARGPVAFSWHNLANTSHTVVITSSGGSGNCPVDFFSQLYTPAQMAPTMFFEIPYLDATGYATSPSLGSTAASDAASAIIRGLAQTYYLLGFAVTYVATNSTYVLATGLDTADHIHPNNTGHSQIYTAMNAKAV